MMFGRGVFCSRLLLVLFSVLIGGSTAEDVLVNSELDTVANAQACNITVASPEYVCNVRSAMQYCVESTKSKDCKISFLPDMNIVMNSDLRAIEYEFTIDEVTKDFYLLGNNTLFRKAF